MKKTKHQPQANKHSSAAPLASHTPIEAGSTLYKVLWYAVLLAMLGALVKVWTGQPDSKDKKPNEFTAAAFFSGAFQERYEANLLERPFIVELKRYKNDYEYRWFGKVNLDDFFVGKDNYIFGRGMTRAAFGDDYHGLDNISKQVAKAKLVQDSLHHMGVQLLILFAPGKSTTYAEYLPDYVNKTVRKTTNRETYVAECIRQGIPSIDFVALFQQLKQVSKYPLFPQYGSHWSYYAECIAVDTTIRRLEYMLGANLPNLYFGDVQLLDTAKVRDADIFRKIPMHYMPKGKPLAYPQRIAYEQGLGVLPQRIVGIGDSYFRCFFYLGAMQYAFDNSEQWFYYNSIIPESPDNPEVWELNLRAELAKVKAVVIIANEANLKNLGNGFIDDAYQMFAYPDQYKIDKQRSNKVNAFKKKVRKDPGLLARFTKDAHYRGIGLDSLITERALLSKP